jgi:hypothetical protein
MKRTVLWIVMILIIFVSNSCGPHLTKRYKQMNIDKTIYDDGSVKISALVLDIPPTAREISILQMSPEGQAAFITEIGKRTNSIGELLKSLGENIGSPKKDEDIIDLTQFKKRVVFSVEKQVFDEKKTNIELADRIDQLLTKLSNLNNAKFVSWDKFETKYEAVDLGKITNTQNSSLGLEIPFKFSGESTPSKAIIGASKNLTEEVLLRQRYIVLTGSLDKQSACLYQQGVMGIDLAGNFSVDFTIEANSDETKLDRFISIKNLWKGPGIPNDANDIQISFSRLKYPISSNPISCDLTCDYSIRHVVKNGHTIIEGDDVVIYRRGKAKLINNKVTLVRNDELAVRVFRIATKTGGYLLHLKRSGTTMPLHFFDFQNAKSFLEWLQCLKSKTVGDYEIWRLEGPNNPNNRSITEQDILDLEIKGDFLNYPQKDKTKEEQNPRR